MLQQLSIAKTATALSRIVRRQRGYGARCIRAVAAKSAMAVALLLISSHRINIAALPPE
jgi:hypothetical protein